MSKKLINRIKWLESMIDKAAEYVNKVEKENKKLKAKVAELLKDRRYLLEGFWKADELEKENKELKLKIRDLERSKRADEMLIRDLYNFLNQKEVCASKTRINYNAGKLDFESEVYYKDEYSYSEPETSNDDNEFRVELKKALAAKMRKNFDIKG